MIRQGVRICRYTVRIIPECCPDVTGNSVRMLPKYALSTNLSKYTEKILSNNDFYRAFIFLHYDKDNWRDLYCVYEVIRDVVGNGNDKSGEKIIKSWLPDKDKSMINIFTQTANSIKAVKEQARHGKVFNAPKIKINLFNAKNLIYKILLIWLENYS